MKKYFLIVSAKVENQEHVASYKEVAAPIMKKFGGIMPPKNYKVGKILAGDLSPEFLLKIEFPNNQSIIDAFNSEEYLKIIPTRDLGFSNVSIYTVEE